MREEKRARRGASSDEEKLLARLGLVTFIPTPQSPMRNEQPAGIPFTPHTSQTLNMARSSFWRGPVEHAMHNNHVFKPINAKSQNVQCPLPNPSKSKVRCHCRAMHSCTHAHAHTLAYLRAHPFVD